MSEQALLKKQAVALRYREKQDRAPKVVANGRGALAEKLIELARQHGIPIREDQNLLQILSRLDLEQEIPPRVYQAVAAILAFVYRVSREAGRASDSKKPNSI